MLNAQLFHRTRAAALALAFAVAVPATARAQAAEENDEVAAETTVVNSGPANRAVYRQAQAYRGTKITISTNERRLRLIAGRDTLLDVPVAIGMNKDFEYEGKKFRFATPTGVRKVRGKVKDPVWTPPEWHYMEKAAARDLELVRLSARDTIMLADSSYLVTIDGQVGRVNQNGHFWAFTPGTEIIFDGRIFMPPLSSAQRKVPDALGPYKLDMGNGYLIHGTHIYNEDSIGAAVSHGCVRMDNTDVDRLYHLVETGVPIFIY
jgi:lipoprotein-anchoring transpeptidase ErfK/SrfK